MVHVTERAKEVLLEIRRLANINDPDTSLRLARSSGRKLALVAELSELILAGRTVDYTQTGGKVDLVLTSPGDRAPGL